MDFVAERRHQGLSWRQILKEWDQGRPKAQRYGPDGLRNLKRDFEATYIAVLSPRFRIGPGRTPS